MADKALPPPPPPPLSPGIWAPEASYSGKEPLDVRVLDWLFGGRKKKPR